jgi:uncharacterized protein YutE (UPF0331/DUF86 family)
MAAERQIIDIGLTKLRRYIRKLQDAPLHHIDQDAAEEMPETIEQTFRRLVVLSTNLANHMIARLRLPTPNDPIDIFNVLSQAGVLPSDLAARLRDVAMLRVKLAHGYQDIAPEEIQIWIPQRLGDFAAFADWAAAALFKE